MECPEVTFYNQLKLLAEGGRTAARVISAQLGGHRSVSQGLIYYEHTKTQIRAVGSNAEQKGLYKRGRPVSRIRRPQ